MAEAQSQVYRCWRCEGGGGDGGGGGGDGVAVVVSRESSFITLLPRREAFERSLHPPPEPDLQPGQLHP